VVIQFSELIFLLVPFSLLAKQRSETSDQGARSLFQEALPFPLASCAFCAHF
jgi:hypothetical protein